MKTKNKACIRRDGVSFLSEPSSPNRCANTLDATNPQIVTDLRKGGFGLESVSSVDEKRVKRSIDECELSTAQLNFNSICLDSMLLEHRESVNVNRTRNKNTKDESPFHANLPHEPSQHQVPDVPTFTGYCLTLFCALHFSSQLFQTDDVLFSYWLQGSRTCRLF